MHLKPAISKTRKTSQLVILTQDFQPEQLDSLNRVYKNLKTHNYVQGESLFPNTTKPTDIFILGQGIAPFDFWQLENTNTHFLANEVTSGIIKLNYNQNPLSGVPISIKGRYSKPKKDINYIS